MIINPTPLHPNRVKLVRMDWRSIRCNTPFLAWLDAAPNLKPV